MTRTERSAGQPGNAKEDAQAPRGERVGSGDKPRRSPSWRRRFRTSFAATICACALGVHALAESPALSGAAASTSRPLADSSLSVLEDTARVFESVAQIASPAVVYLETKIRDDKGKVSTEESGSGVLIRPRGYGRAVVATNHHVVAGGKLNDIDIHLAAGELLHPKKIWHDEQTDLAFLDVGQDDLPAAKMGDSDEVRIGQWVLVIGSPFGLTQSVTHGIISAKQRRQLGLPGTTRIKEFIQTDAPINPGNSGGPLVNLRGEVIGLSTAIASHTGSNSGVGFAIPVNLVRWVAEELVEHGKVRRAFLGVGFPGEFSYDKARSLGLTFPRGAFISSIHPGSPADQGGIRTGDVILTFAGQTIDDEHHLINTVSQSPIGKTVDVVVWRERKQKTLQIELGAWEE